ncbi:amino acid permease/ SLC12A domain-containing protein [Emericellopsis atlantica]|uniref:Amino acid permease/ SLC12A domain-containing protein n=1 Tax=Emericellopsis atlantica TaxID=2614577 RepID=A0A9P7ZUB1_9HYPO|nr:amino acid permease/ SLC12A domain-containing protein [Emericellopsis atlantica]KAG9258473.1 amino acid permease/ SLC12A domain-containing protein [Emericellopsis atlantica]
MFSRKGDEKAAAPAATSRDSNDAKYSGQFDADNSDGLQRRLNNRQIQLIAIGGTIGTGLFISIGAGLAKGGPGSLLVCYILYASVVALVNNSIAEMTTYMPVSGGFIRLAGNWVDDALGFMVGWNFFLYEALLIPFEVVALNLVLSFWNEKVTEPGPTAGICAAIIISYGLLNVVAVGVFGEAEFWLSGGKVILIFMLFGFTFVTMVGGNPSGHAYGFSHWNSPAAFLEYHTSGDQGRFEGFMGALATAAFVIVGPDYISMVAAEAKHPSIYIKTAFKTVYVRFGLFFIGGALATGIVLPSNDRALVDIHINGGGGQTAGASPYVMAMENMGIDVLPHVVNALLFTTIYSAGNTYTYCATRSLYSLALEGRAPAFFRKCTAQGVPIYCFAFTMLFPLLSFLQVNSGSAEALSILLSLITGGGVVDYIVMSITFLFYYRACKLQGVDRKTRPYYGYLQPYGAWVALVLQVIVLYTYGYTAFTPWSTKNFFANYTMQLLAPLMFIGWKLIKKTKFVKPEECDLVWDRPIIDAYEAKAMDLDPPTGFWQEMGQMVGLGRKKKVIKEEEL